LLPGILAGTSVGQTV